MGQPILVIDDSLTVRKILETSLSRAGFDAYSFPDGIQAIQALTAKQVPHPDAIILDIGLPKMDGYTVARILKRHHGLNHTVIILLSGHDGRLDKLRGRLAGASAYVTKPFQPAHVIDVLRSQLSAHESASEAAERQEMLRAKTGQAP